jgi:hypothetical protein
MRDCPNGGLLEQAKTCSHMAEALSQDLFRGTGRTTRNLMRAVLNTLDGYNSVVVCASMRYAYELTRRAHSIINGAGVTDYESNRHNRTGCVIVLFGCELVLTSNEIYCACPELKDHALYLDHYKG